MATSIFSPASQVIERHQDRFIDRTILISGDIQDEYPVNIDAKNVKIHCNQFHTYMRLKKTAQKRDIVFSLVPDIWLYEGVDTLIYYWPKSKNEAQFQLAFLLNKLDKNCAIFIVGENRTGVKSVERLLSEFGDIQKIDSARRCGLYYFQADCRTDFDLASWWTYYELIINHTEIKIQSLPGVFSQKSLDSGTALLIEAILEHPELIKGHILDVGCGTGILSAVIGKLFHDIDLTLSDVSIAAIESSKATLDCNQISTKLTTRVIESDVFSHITEKYHLIISNPPFHDGKQTSYTAANQLIQQAKLHLKLRGYLCIVANSFLPYQQILKDAFNQVEVIASNSKFKVYLASH